MSLHIIILAAGLGKRMHSKLPKVLHPVGGKPMVQHVFETAQSLTPEAIHVVVGHEAAQIKEALSDLPAQWVCQTEQLGTGHAVLQALPAIPSNAKVLILSADVPLVRKETLSALLKEAAPDSHANPPLALLVAKVDDPGGLGRIVRDKNDKLIAIVEEKDANETERNIHEIYSGICCTSAGALKRWLPQLNQSNAQGEYYLTEIIAMAAAEGGVIRSEQVSDPIEISGANNRLQLQELERALQQRLSKTLMTKGVTIADAARIDIRGELDCGQDVFIDVNTLFEGRVHLGDNCTVGPNCVLKNVTVAPGSTILANSVLENCTIGEHCQIGPFARIRPGTQLAAFCKIGNFVETKNAVFDQHSKASHLSYLGDVTIGRAVNIGAGTITCNYDGVNKHQTIIEDGAFIGSDTQLIAPVTVGKEATIGAGSTIRKNAPPGALTVNESKQKTILGWKRPEDRK